MEARDASSLSHMYPYEQSDVIFLFEEIDGEALYIVLMICCFFLESFCYGGLCYVFLLR